VTLLPGYKAGSILLLIGLWSTKEAGSTRGRAVRPGPYQARFEQGGL